MAKELKKLCPSLEALYISYDQIFQVELLKSVPSTLTHLSLTYCNLSLQNLRAIFTPGTCLILYYTNGNSWNWLSKSASLDM